MTKLDAGLITSLPASDPGSAAVWGSKRINLRPQFCLCLAWSGCPSNDDDDDTEIREYTSENVANVDTVNAIYVYCDVIKHRTVGHDKIQYHLVLKKNFSDIHISLRDD